MAEVESLIDFLRIKQKSVHKLFGKNKIQTIKHLANLQSFCYDPGHSKKYHKHLISFRIHAPIEKVWETYKTISPQDTWKGRMVSFGVMYSRKKNQLSFQDDTYHGIEPGQLIFLNLNLFGNLTHLAVGHEVVGVYDDRMQIKICYVQNGASVGTQLIQLKKVNDTETEVFHETWYTSGSWVRDKILYPVFHARAVGEFHTNVKKSAEALKV
jgi:hypothetical protein